MEVAVKRAGVSVRVVQAIIEMTIVRSPAADPTTTKSEPDTAINSASDETAPESAIEAVVEAIEFAAVVEGCQ